VFPVTGPRTWNNLPASIRSAPSLLSFKRQLKTCLFSCRYTWHCFSIPTIVDLTVFFNLGHFKKLLYITLHNCTLQHCHTEQSSDSSGGLCCYKFKIKSLENQQWGISQSIRCWVSKQAQAARQSPWLPCCLCLLIRPHARWRVPSSRSGLFEQSCVWVWQFILALRIWRFYLWLTIWVHWLLCCRVKLPSHHWLYTSSM